MLDQIKLRGVPTQYECIHQMRMPLKACVIPHQYVNLVGLFIVFSVVADSVDYIFFFEDWSRSHQIVD